MQNWNSCWKNWKTKRTSHLPATILFNSNSETRNDCCHDSWQKAKRNLSETHIHDADLPGDQCDYLLDAWLQVQESARKSDWTRTKKQMLRDMDERDER